MAVDHTSFNYKQIKRAYWIRLTTRQEQYDSLMVKLGDITRRTRSAMKALDEAQLAYDNLKPPSDNSANE